MTINPNSVFASFTKPENHTAAYYKIATGKLQKQVDAFLEQPHFEQIEHDLVHHVRTLAWIKSQEGKEHLAEIIDDLVDFVDTQTKGAADVSPHDRRQVAKLTAAALDQIDEGDEPALDAWGVVPAILQQAGRLVEAPYVNKVDDKTLQQKKSLLNFAAAKELIVDRVPVSLSNHILSALTPSAPMASARRMRNFVWFTGMRQLTGYEGMARHFAAHVANRGGPIVLENAKDRNAIPADKVEKGYDYLSALTAYTLQTPPEDAFIKSRVNEQRISTMRFLSEAAPNKEVRSQIEKQLEKVPSSLRQNAADIPFEKPKEFELTAAPVVDYVYGAAGSGFSKKGVHRIQDGFNTLSEEAQKNLLTAFSFASTLREVADVGDHILAARTAMHHPSLARAASFVAQTLKVG